MHLKISVLELKYVPLKHFDCSALYLPTKQKPPEGGFFACGFYQRSSALERTDYTLRLIKRISRITERYRTNCFSPILRIMSISLSLLLMISNRSSTVISEKGRFKASIRPSRSFVMTSNALYRNLSSSSKCMRYLMLEIMSRHSRTETRFGETLRTSARFLTMPVQVRLVLVSITICQCSRFRV